MISIKPIYWRILTAKLMGMIIFNNHKVVFRALGKADKTADFVLSSVVVIIKYLKKERLSHDNPIFN